MADALKHFFDRTLVRSLAAELRGAHPPLNENAFVTACMNGLDELELLARGEHIASVMRAHLPGDFAAAARALVRSLGPELDRTEGSGMTPFRYLPHTMFVQHNGLEHFEEAMRAQHELTRRFSCEASIRAFLVRHPEATYDRLVEWARDPNVHVRRLVSEGTRPRLPWAPRLRAFQQDPRPVIHLLELLRDDPERYVQRSVANNLNDIAKDHPDIAVEVCRRWLIDAPATRQWIVRHALRSLVKAGHRGALATIGAAAVPRVTVGAVRLTPRRVPLGTTLSFSFSLTSDGDHAQDLLVDFAVHFVKQSGERRPKVFKLRRLTLAPGARVDLAAQVSFAEMTTRKPRPGRHLIEARINGTSFPLSEFDVVAPRP